jgi:ribonuclease P protein component
MDGCRNGVNHAAAPLPAPSGLDDALRLPRERRLDPAGFRDTFDGNETQAGRFLVMWLRKSGTGQGRVGVMATKRLFRHAVDRNRARRLLRETYRLNQPRLLPGVDLILLARRPMAGIRRAELDREFARLARKARIWREDGSC